MCSNMVKIAQDVKLESSSSKCSYPGRCDPGLCRDSAPPGWYLCDGSSKPTSGDAALFAATAAAVPTSTCPTCAAGRQGHGRHGGGAPEHTARRAQRRAVDPRRRAIGEADHGSTGVAPHPAGVDPGTRTSPDNELRQRLRRHELPDRGEPRQHWLYITCNTASATTGIGPSGASGDAAHQNTQPTMVMNKIIKR